jgi:hypothetical protein
MDKKFAAGILSHVPKHARGGPTNGRAESRRQPIPRAWDRATERQ